MRGGAGNLKHKNVAAWKSKVRNVSLQSAAFSASCSKKKKLQVRGLIVPDWNRGHMKHQLVICYCCCSPRVSSAGRSPGTLDGKGSRGPRPPRPRRRAGVTGPVGCFQGGGGERPPGNGTPAARAPSCRGTHVSSGVAPPGTSTHCTANRRSPGDDRSGPDS